MILCEHFFRIMSEIITSRALISVTGTAIITTFTPKTKENFLYNTGVVNSSTVVARPIGHFMRETLI